MPDRDGEGKVVTIRGQWTVDTLKALLDERDRRYELLANTFKESLTIFREESEKWRAMQNEWRQTMNDKDRAFITKGQAWGYMVGAIGLIFGIMQILDKFGKP